MKGHVEVAVGGDVRGRAGAGGSSAPQGKALRSQGGDGQCASKRQLDMTGNFRCHHFEMLIALS